MATKITATSKLYHYRAKVQNVVDGDTLDLSIDLGFDIQFSLRVRLYGVDTPEKTGKTKVAGQAATAFTKAAVLNKDVTIETIADKTEKFGRFLAKVYYDKSGVEACLNDDLISSGNALAYYGDKKPG